MLDYWLLQEATEVISRKLNSILLYVYLDQKDDLILGVDPKRRPQGGSQEHKVSQDCAKLSKATFNAACVAWS